MERHDWQTAETIWKWGVYAPSNDAYIEFMRIRDRLESVDGVHVWPYHVRTSVTRDDAYIASLDVRRVQGNNTNSFDIALLWKDGIWRLLIDPGTYPSYVMQSLEQRAH